MTSEGLAQYACFKLFSQVVEKVRLQYGCSTLAGAPLEDQGGTGSSNSHWEFELFQVGSRTVPGSSTGPGRGRITAEPESVPILMDKSPCYGILVTNPASLWSQGELMTSSPPADAGNQRVSALTLALLQDTGW